jgi:hypothetical protein
MLLLLLLLLQQQQRSDMVGNVEASGSSRSSGLAAWSPCCFEAVWMLL